MESSYLGFGFDSVSSNSNRLLFQAGYIINRPNDGFQIYSMPYKKNDNRVTDEEISRHSYALGMLSDIYTINTSDISILFRFTYNGSTLAY